MPDTIYTITQKNSPDIVAGAATNTQPPTLTRGETVSLSFEFFEAGGAQTLTVPSGETVTVPAGETWYYGDTDVDGTLDIDGTLVLTGSGQYTRLLEYLDYADRADYGLTDAGVPWYRERVPSRAAVDSLVLQFTPSAALQALNAPGLWGIVTGGQDDRGSPLASERIDLEVFVLAEASEYSSHSDIESDLAA